MKLKHYLIASEHNDYRPWITSRHALVYFTIIVWGLRLLLPESITLAQKYLDPTEIASQINRERSARNIPTLITNDKLVSAAQTKANDMLARSYFAHINPDGQYVWPIIEANGYKPYQTLGENLAMDFTSVGELVDAWMNSPTHRSNILNEKFADQGVAQATGIYDNDHETIVVTSLFGTLSKSNITESIKPQTASSTSNKLTIQNDAKISITQVSGRTLIDIALSISGSPTLITAKLKTQSINLLQNSEGKYQGTFTFNLSEELSGEKIDIEARDRAGNKSVSSVTLNNIPSLPEPADTSASPKTAALGGIPVSDEAQIMQILRVVFGLLSVIYLMFLVTDWIIIRRSHIDRPGMRLAPQIIIFMLIAAINIFGKF